MIRAITLFPLTRLKVSSGEGKAAENYLHEWFMTTDAMFGDYEAAVAAAVAAGASAVIDIVASVVAAIAAGILIEPV